MSIRMLEAKFWRISNHRRHGDAHYISPSAPYHGRACCKRYLAMEEAGAVAATAGQIIAALGGYAVVLAALFAFIGKIWVSRIVERERNLLQRQLDETNRRL